jgi:hypothetical protein
MLVKNPTGMSVALKTMAAGRGPAAYLLAITTWPRWPRRFLAVGCRPYALASGCLQPYYLAGLRAGVMANLP